MAQSTDELAENVTIHDASDSHYSIHKPFRAPLGTSRYLYHAIRLYDFRQANTLAETANRLAAIV